MNRVVVTGIGTVCSIGNSSRELLDSLRRSRSGIRFMQEMQELGFKCCLYAPVDEPNVSSIGRKNQRAMSDAARYAVICADEALRDAGLSIEEVQNERTGVVIGTGGGGLSSITVAEELLATHKSTSRLGGSGAVKIMNSTAAANVAVHLGVKGRTCSLSSACTTGIHNIGHAYDLLRYGILDKCICGAAEESSWMAVGAWFENLGLLSTGWNDRPEKASRPYDRDRRGIVMSSGAAVLVLETLDAARKRNVPIYAEVVGYGSSNDGRDMFLPDGEGLRRAIDQALLQALGQGVGAIDYINPHGAGTPLGDRVEASVIREIFGRSVWVSSTKGIIGYAMAASGAIEAVCTLLMLKHSFIAPTVNLENISSECDGIRHVQEIQEDVPLKAALSFNYGFGGTNACLVFKKL